MRRCSSPVVPLARATMPAYAMKRGPEWLGCVFTRERRNGVPTAGPYWPWGILGSKVHPRNYQRNHPGIPR